MKSNLRTEGGWGGWLEHWRPLAGHHVRVFCFHHAGGTAAAFRGWQEYLAPEIEVCPIELPGRGRRCEEPPGSEVEDVVRSLTSTLLPLFQKGRFALFGHSMGALLAFEVARFLQDEYEVITDMVFLAGARAPHKCGEGQLRSNLPTSELLMELRRINGTPLELLSDAEAIEFILRILRSDLRMLETHQFLRYAKLCCPIVAFGGEADPEVSFTDLDAWRAYTSSDFTVQMFGGDHFFVHQSRPAVLNSLARRLLQASHRQFI